MCTLNAVVAGALSYTNQFCFYSIAAGSIVLSASFPSTTSASSPAFLCSISPSLPLQTLTPTPPTVLPGYLVLCAALEVANRSIVSGSVRITYSALYALFLGFGLSAGAEIYTMGGREQLAGGGDYTVRLFSFLSSTPRNKADFASLNSVPTSAPTLRGGDKPSRSGTVRLRFSFFLLFLLFLELTMISGQTSSPYPASCSSWPSSTVSPSSGAIRSQWWSLVVVVRPFFPFSSSLHTDIASLRSPHTSRPLSSFSPLVRRLPQPSPPTSSPPTPSQTCLLSRPVSLLSSLGSLVTPTLASLESRHSWCRLSGCLCSCRVVRSSFSF
jgi:hypothetical protein